MKDAYMKKYLPGANTYRGFFSFYQNLIQGLDRVFIIKGGPGTGKSTFINKIAEYFSDKGENIELLCCSGDVSSYDGLIIVNKGIAIVDGTPPHILEPQNPGAVEEILNFGQLWDDKLLIKNKDKIVDLTHKKSDCYSKAYSKLQVAKGISDSLSNIYKHHTDFNNNYKIEAQLIEEYFKNTLDKISKQRHMFISSITHAGYLNYYHSVTKNSKIRIGILGAPGTGKSTLLKNIGKAAVQKGYDVDFYHCGFDPEKIHLIDIKEISTAIFDVSQPQIYINYDNMLDLEIDLNKNCYMNEINNQKDDIRKLEQIFDYFIAKAVDYLAQAKDFHNLLEQYYKKAMCFSQHECLAEKVIQKIEWCIDLN